MAKMATGQVALVTGAAGGIGRELARLLAKDGYTLVLVGRTEETLAEAAAELAGLSGADAHVIAQDLAAEGAAEAVAQRVAELGLSVDVLVNNAGFGYDAPFAQSSPERQRDLLQVNNTALTELCLAFLPGMITRGRGGILNVASIAGFMPGPYMATYYASKAYVQSLTQALHVELRPCGVHATALCPGPVSTNFWRAADAGHTALARATLPAPAVARAGYAAFKLNKAACVPGLLPKAVVFSTRLLPRGLIARIASALQRPAMPNKAGAI